jgi:hypothetical protein
MMYKILLATFLLLPATAWAQCANGLMVNCPDAVNPQSSDYLLLWQNSQNPHSRRLQLGQIPGGGGGVGQVTNNLGQSVFNNLGQAVFATH